MNDAAPLRTTRMGSALIATICRPDRGNSLSRATLSAFAELQAQLTADASVRALVITGEGERVFCAGADLKERRGMSLDETREQLRAYRSELGWIDGCPVPVIAAINGAALGGGAELALLCDLRIAVDHATIAFPETSLGVIPGAGGTQRLPRLIGEARAKQMILLGTRLTAAQALDWGLVHAIVPSTESLLERALRYIEPILEGAPLAQRAALDAIDAARELPLAEGLERELAAYEPCLQSADRLEALTAFAEKRRPVFRGS